MFYSIKKSEGLHCISRDLLVFTVCIWLALVTPFLGPYADAARAADLFVDASTGTDSGECQAAPWGHLLREPVSHRGVGAYESEHSVGWYARR